MKPPNEQREDAVPPGAALRDARLARGATTGEAAEATRIKVQTIEAMERDDYGRIPAPTYAKGFIKLYAEYLGLDPAPLVQAYEECNQPPERRRVQGKFLQSVREGEPETAREESAPRWIDVLPPTGVARRVALAVAALVLAVLVLAGLTRFVSGCAARRAGPEQPLPTVDESAWMRAAEPPDPYLEAPGR